jgi:cardiolipin synthase (CMP-forming)
VDVADVATDRVVTVPNALSMLRLLGVPVFLWLILGPQADGAAVLLLMASGVTDYLDGVIARRWHQVSRVGQLLDPLADRLYIIATLLGLGLRGIVPWWLLAVIVLRDVVLGVALLVMRRHGLGPPPVHYLGKAATLNLLYAFPLLLLGDGAGTGAEVARVIGWAFAIWGAGLYWWAGVLYLGQIRRVVSTAREPEEAA